MKKYAFLLAFVVALPLPAGAQIVVDKIIAVVNSDIILQSELEEQSITMESLLTETYEGAELLDAVEEGRANLLRDMIDRSLLIQKAEEYGIDGSLEVVRTMEQLREDYDFETLEDLEEAIISQGDSLEEYREMIRTQYLTEVLVSQEVYRNIIVTNEEAREYYEANLESFDSPPGVQIQEIVILRSPDPEADEAARAKADEALDRVRDGEDFGLVAFEMSEVESSQSGGALGFFETGQLGEVYANAVTELDRNGVGEIIELPDAFLILKLVDRHDGGIRAFELSFQEIQQFLASLQYDDARREYVNELRRESFIDIKAGYVDTGAVSEDAGE